MSSRERCHFIGIGGVGMSGLARLLLKQDLDVSGSDLASNYVTEKLVKEGAKVGIGHHEDNVAKGMTVVYTTGIDERNPEFAAAVRYQCPMLHRSDLLRRLMEGHQTLAVAGTHGKTTTSSLLASTLAHAGKDPTFAIGGTLVEFQSNARKGSGPHFVAEACESDGTFTKYHPYGAIVTNVDLDHMDFFGTEQALTNAFRSFIANVSHPEHLFWCGDDPRLKGLRPPGHSYGYGEGNALRVLNVRQEGWRLFFDILFNGTAYKAIEIPLVGLHNALNAASVFGMCLSLGIEERVIRSGLAAFQGVNRRCEKKGQVREVLVIDDYAHHPTEIYTTLKGIRKAIGDRRLLAVFQPHRYTRTKDCLGSFARAFDAADEVIVTDIYSAQEKPIPGVASEIVVEEIASNHRVRASYIPKESLAEHIAALARPHDVIVTVGAGDITKLGPELLKKWESTPPRKWRVGVVFGGRSMEHEVSLMSAKNVVDLLDASLYNVDLFGIKKSGRWVYCANSISELADAFEGSEALSPSVLESLQRCDLFFPVLHGPYGEDGTLQGFFDTLGKAYVGCDHRSAAICMDKALTKKIAALNGIPVVPFISFSEHDWREGRDALAARVGAELRYPVFVKPLHLGSTVGISKVNAPDGLEAALEAAFKVDTFVLVENGLQVREIEFAVIGNDTAATFPPGEILTGGRVYDYQGKYDDKDPIKAVPKSVLPSSIIESGMVLATKAYLAAECKGMARVDFFLDHEERLWLNEINPIPGFTKNSLYPQICAANGMAGNILADKLVILALQRKRQLQRSLENL